MGTWEKTFRTTLYKYLDQFYCFLVHMSYIKFPCMGVRSIKSFKLISIVSSFLFLVGIFIEIFHIGCF
jgi:hypothetical protein